MPDKLRPPNSPPRLKPHVEITDEQIWRLSLNRHICRLEEENKNLKDKIKVLIEDGCGCKNPGSCVSIFQDRLQKLLKEQG